MDTDKPAALIQIKLGFESVGFVTEGGKPENPEKKPLEQVQNQRQTQPTCDRDYRNLNRVTKVGGERKLSPVPFDHDFCGDWPTHHFIPSTKVGPMIS